MKIISIALFQVCFLALQVSSDWILNSMTSLNFDPEIHLEGFRDIEENDFHHPTGDRLSMSRSDHLAFVSAILHDQGFITLSNEGGACISGSIVLADGISPQRFSSSNNNKFQPKSPIHSAQLLFLMPPPGYKSSSDITLKFNSFWDCLIITKSKSLCLFQLSLAVTDWSIIYLEANWVPIRTSISPTYHCCGNVYNSGLKILPYFDSAGNNGQKILIWEENSESSTSLIADSLNGTVMVKFSFSSGSVLAEVFSPGHLNATIHSIKPPTAQNPLITNCENPFTSEDMSHKPSLPQNCDLSTDFGWHVILFYGPDTDPKTTEADGEVLNNELRTQLFMLTESYEIMDWLTRFRASLDYPKWMFRLLIVSVRGIITNPTKIPIMDLPDTSRNISMSSTELARAVARFHEYKPQYINRNIRRRPLSCASIDEVDQNAINRLNKQFK